MAGLIHISSADRTSTSTSSADFKLDFKHSIEKGKYEVLSISMPNSIYNVIADVNDTIYTTLGDATLTPGFYTASELATEAQTQLITANSGYTCTWSATTKKFTIANASSFQLDFLANAANGDSAHKLLGFGLENTASGTSVSSSQAVDLTPYKSIMIDITSASGNIISSNSSSNGGQIYLALDEAHGSVVNFTPEKYQQWLSFRNSTSDLRIRVYTTDGKVAAIRNADWEIFMRKVM